MFTRKPDRGVLPANARTPPPLSGPRAGQRRPAAGVVSVIGPDLAITGNLETTGEVRIEGDVQGDIHAGRIVVGAQGRVVGDLLADEIVIGGVVQGSIRGNTLTFQGASHIEGDVYHRKLAIEQGAYFEGKSRRSDDPMALQRNPNGGPPR
jgi:cytoskeletal protein CcmA (bactofilin family)